MQRGFIFAEYLNSLRPECYESLISDFIFTGTKSSKPVSYKFKMKNRPHNVCLQVKALQGAVHLVSCPLVLVFCSKMF